MTLRARVIAAVGVIALTFVAVMIFLTRTTAANLTAQVDEDLKEATRPVKDSGAFGRDQGPGLSVFGARPDGDDAARLSSIYVGVVVNGELSTVYKPGLSEDDFGLPEIPAAEATAAAADGKPFTVRAHDSEGRWRVVASQADSDTITVIAMPLAGVDSAVGNLIALELIGGGVIFVALALVAFWVIRLGANPIRQMTHTASAIAAGDLTQRVPESSPGTEAGELGDALNRMLANIEASFDERDRADERLRQFVADASHELRTPVATIRGYAELYRAGGLADKERLDDAMRRTEDEAVRMGGLVEDLLSLARLDEGRPLDRTNFDLAGVVRDAAANAAVVDLDRTVEVDAPDAVLVDADEERIRQVVANLVGNARVHTPVGTTVSLRAFTGDQGPTVEVSDDGPGMPPEAVQHAFERFYRADPSRSRNDGGNGLGLAIVEGVVRAHGGVVSIDSTLGEGTTVRVVLPPSSGDERPTGESRVPSEL